MMRNFQIMCFTCGNLPPTSYWVLALFCSLLLCLWSWSKLYSVIQGVDITEQSLFWQSFFFWWTAGSGNCFRWNSVCIFFVIFYYMCWINAMVYHMNLLLQKKHTSYVHASKFWKQLKPHSLAQLQSFQESAD